MPDRPPIPNPPAPKLNRAPSDPWGWTVIALQTIAGLMVVAIWLALIVWVGQYVETTNWYRFCKCLTVMLAIVSPILVGAVAVDLLNRWEKP